MAELWLDPIAGGASVGVGRSTGGFTIGRNSEADFVIEDPSCSRDHACIVWTADGYRLVPRSLRQPTLVNGTAHDRPVLIHHGDIIGFGAVQLRARIERNRQSELASNFGDDENRAKSSHAEQTLVGNTGPLSAKSPHSDWIQVGASLVFGRGTDSTPSHFTLDHPTVSIRHAVVLQTNGGLSIRDLGSTNGTYVNDKRVSETHTLRDGDLLRIGPCTFRVGGFALQPVFRAKSAVLTVAALSVQAPTKAGVVNLLSSASMQIAQGEFTAIIGPSGCGKSTLLRAMSGRTMPTSGTVHWKSSNLHENFASLKTDITFVPQRELLPELLTVEEALTYTARLRLPADTTAAERAHIVEDAIRTVGLTEQANARISTLSGGQRKRTGLANELILNPSLMFLDEVTSGLDESSDEELMALFRLLADRGMMVICVTHTLAHVERFCHSIVAMARGGTLAYHGPTDAARKYFGVDHLNKIYGALNARRSEEWAEEKRAHSPYESRVLVTETRQTAVHERATPRRDHRRPFAQLPVLLGRYARISFADKRTVWTGFAQGIVIAVLLRIVFGNDAIDAPHQQQLVFLIGTCAFWFGCNNAARELVKERELFSHELDVNLRISAYLASKIILLVGIGIAQCATLLAVCSLLSLDVPNLVDMAMILSCTVGAGTACGLLISAGSNSEDQAITLIPIVLIPQLLLAGAIIAPLNGVSSFVARRVIAAYWMFESQTRALATPPLSYAGTVARLLLHMIVYAVAVIIVLDVRERRRRARLIGS